MVGPSINTVGSTRFLGSRSSWFIVFLIFLNLSSPSISIGPNSTRAPTPPRGWNSYDSFCWIISEEDFLKSADIISKQLLPHGYEYAVVDYLWYRKNVDGASTTSYGFDVFDQWGRPQPDPARWPSSKDGKGFTEVAKQVHDKKLKFGIHVMGGMSKQAFDLNTLIMDPVKGGPYIENGRQWRAQDIGLKDKACKWMQHGFISVNATLGAGKAFLKSLYLQYAEWGVDFIKHDCVFGDDLVLDEITYVSEVIRGLNRPVVYSLSPGTSVTPAMAKQVSQLVNMYRITGDDWDKWTDVLSHFDVSRDMAAAQMIGAQGLFGQSWPDLDMLPFGWLTDPNSNRGPFRYSRLTPDEQRTQMTLWSIAKSPLMFGGDVRKVDQDLHNLLTNPTLLEINAYSHDNKEFPYATVLKTTAGDLLRNVIKSLNPFAEAAAPSGFRAWTARGRNGEVYLAIFNLDNDKKTASVKISDLSRAVSDNNITTASCKSVELFSGKSFGPNVDSVSIEIASHAPALFTFTCGNP